MLAARVKLIEQSNVHRLAQDQLDHESKEEIFQHKMQAYDKIVFTPPTTDGVLALHSANTRFAWRKLLSVLMGESIYKIAGTSLS